MLVKAPPSNSSPKKSTTKFIDLDNLENSTMPGHVKRGGTGEPDPDPSQYLFVSYEDKQKDLAKVCRRHFLEKSFDTLIFLFVAFPKPLKSGCKQKCLQKPFLCDPYVISRFH